METSPKLLVFAQGFPNIRGHDAMFGHELSQPIGADAQFFAPIGTS
jgi:hypothetical protein